MSHCRGALRRTLCDLAACDHLLEHFLSERRNRGRPVAISGADVELSADGLVAIAISELLEVGAGKGPLRLRYRLEVRHHGVDACGVAELVCPGHVAMGGEHPERLSEGTGMGRVRVRVAASA